MMRHVSLALSPLLDKLTQLGQLRGEFFLQFRSEFFGFSGNDQLHFVPPLQPDLRI